MFFDMRAVLRDLRRRLAERPSRRARLMPAKPHRVLLDRVSGYADEAAAFMRRRRVSRRPFARLYYPGRPQRRPRRGLAQPAPSCSSPPGA